MRKFECNNCPNRHCYTENTQNDIPEKCLFDGRDASWQRAKTHPTLTVEALAERGIEWPDGAECAMVYSDGKATFCKSRMTVDEHGYFQSSIPVADIPGTWDTEKNCVDWRANWFNYIIERPAVVKENLITELPEWCRVGAWVRIDSPGLGHGEIRRIKEIQHKQDGQWIVFDPLKGNHLVIGGSKNLTRFAVRPWTFAEAPARLKIAKRSGEVLDLDLCVILSEGTGCYYYIDNRRSMIEASELVKHIQPDGKPCGVLEVVE